LGDGQVERIDSPQNPRIKAALKLRQSRGRQQTGQFLIDGLRENVRALILGQKLEALFLCPSMLAESDTAQLLQFVALYRLPVWELSPAAFEKLAYGQRAEGVVGVGRSVPRRLEDWAAPTRDSIYLIIDGIEKPGNLGAVFRTADAVGVAGIVLTQPAVLPENPNAIRASMGTVFSVPYAQASIGQTGSWLAGHGIPLYSTRVDASQDYWDVNYLANDAKSGAPLPSGVAILMGCEAQGLGPEWSTVPSTGIRIPQSGVADSLNLSVAAAIVLYEVARQRQRLATGEPR